MFSLTWKKLRNEKYYCNGEGKFGGWLQGLVGWEVGIKGMFFREESNVWADFLKKLLKFEGMSMVGVYTS